MGKSYSQIPLYYKFKKVSGTILSDNEEIFIEFHSRRKLIIENCKDKNLEEFIRTLSISKTGRKQLEHIISSKSKVSIKVFDKVGFTKYDGKFRLIAGITCHPEKTSIIEYDGDSTYSEISISVFKKTLEYIASPFKKDSSNSIYYNLDSNKNDLINYDSVIFQPVMFKEYLYKNQRELYYYCGVHEIEHTKTSNIYLQQYYSFGEVEHDAFKVEVKEFKKRRRINKRKIKWFYK